MSRSLFLRIAFLILTTTWLAACAGSVLDTASPFVEASPTSPCPSSGAITISLTTRQPAEVLLEFAWEGGFTRPELAFAFGRVAEFSLLPDGSVYYIDPSELDRAQVMVAHLTPTETDALVKRVLDLGLERLESYTDACQPQADGTCLCIADAGESVLRARLPGGELREIRNYADFANDPEALAAVRILLNEYRHPRAEPYTPDRAAIFIRPVLPSPDRPTINWPLDPAWLEGGAPDTLCVRTLSGGDLQALLAVTERNLGDFTFRVADADLIYEVYLVPWLPGVDYADLVADSEQACAPFETPTSLLTLDNTEWTLTSLNAHDPIEGSAITLAFYPDNYLEGSAGCNSYGADYTARGSEFRVDEIHRTEQECDMPADTMQQEADFFDALAGASAYGATEDRLQFEDAAGAAILVFSRKLSPVVDATLEDTEWVLSELRGQNVIEGSRITLNLGEEGFGGSAGCNNYGGEYEEASVGKWATSSIWRTAMDCGQPALMNQEEAFIAALGDAESYRRADGRLEFVDISGEVLLAFALKEEFATQPDDLTGTLWRLITIAGDGLIEGSTITLAFYNETVLGGHAGCRDYVATYQADGDNVNLLVEAMFDTGCLADGALLEQEGRFLDSFSPKADIRLTEGLLEIHGERGAVLVFEVLTQEGALPLEGPVWSLQTIVEPNPFAEEPEPWPVPGGVLGGSKTTITFDDGVASGSAGCNSYGGPYSLHGADLSFGEIANTEKICVDPEGTMEHERHYLDLLADVTGYHIFGDQLWLETSDGRALIFITEVIG